MVALDKFFFNLGDKKVVAGRVKRWLSYTVTIVRELVGTDSTLVVLDKWSSYRGSHISRFDCIQL